MSTDIVTNQISKDVVSSSSSVAKTTNVSQVQSRQNVAAEEGKSLPPDSESSNVSKEELQQAVTQLNDKIQQVQRDLLFSVDDSSGRTVVRVVNTETEEVVRQMPTEEALRISRNIKDQLGDVSGMIFETSA